MLRIHQLGQIKRRNSWFLIIDNHDKNKKYGNFVSYSLKKKRKIATVKWVGLRRITCLKVQRQIRSVFDVGPTIKQYWVTASCYRLSLWSRWIGGNPQFTGWRSGHRSRQDMTIPDYQSQCKARRQYLLALQVSRYCFLALRGTTRPCCGTPVMYVSPWCSLRERNEQGTNRGRVSISAFKNKVRPQRRA